MNLDLELQRVSEHPQIPMESDFRLWAETTLADRRDPVELVIRLVDEEEIHDLNRNYRGKDRPTNILSFPFEAPPPVSSDLLGDLVICAPVVAREAVEQNKTIQAHWAHMVVHGILHLLGYDHEDDAEAEEMESVERTILARLGYDDPYETA